MKNTNGVWQSDAKDLKIGDIVIMNKLYCLAFLGNKEKYDASKRQFVIHNRDVENNFKARIETDPDGKRFTKGEEKYTYRYDIIALDDPSYELNRINGIYLNKL